MSSKIQKKFKKVSWRFVVLLGCFLMNFGVFLIFLRKGFIMKGEKCIKKERFFTKRSHIVEGC